MSIQGAVNNTVGTITGTAVGAAVLNEKAKNDVMAKAESSKADISEAKEKLPELEKSINDIDTQKQGIEDDREILEAKSKGTYYPYDQKLDRFRDPKTNKFVSNDFVMEETHSMEKAAETMKTLEKQRSSIIEQQKMFKLQLERANATLAKTEKKANRLGVKI